jgi:cytochrome c oxidase subunit 2
MPVQLVPQVSTYAADIDNVIAVVGVLVGFWFFVALGAFFFLLWRYRFREGVPAQHIDGSNPKHKRWITIPHNLVLLCDVVILVAAVRVWVDVKQTLPPAGDKVRVIAQQWAWTFQYPGVDGKFDTQDDVKSVDELHVMANTNTHFELVSRDVLHSLSVPVFRLKQDAIPGRVVNGWFNAKNTGVYDIQCAEICGVAHGIMFGRIVIETAEERALWLAAHAPVAVAAPVAVPPITAPPPPGGVPPPPDAPTIH